MTKGVVIAGAGQAGFQVAFSLRTEGFDGPITLIGDEAELPYNRPPLSKAFLTGTDGEDDLPFRPTSFYEERRVRLLMGRRVVSLRRDGREAVLDDGNVVGYDFLVLATGARVRPITVEPIEGLLYLRTTEDARQCKARLETAESLIAIGAGFIGLEVAAAAAKMGKRVTVVAAEDRPMGRVVSPTISERYLKLHQEHGVQVMLGELVDRIEPGLRVVLKSGVRLEAPLAIAGIGVIPNSELAAEAGLATGNGIVVDQYLRTADESIFAIGDCAIACGLRLESVQTAVDQARCVAAAIAGKPRLYRAVPWFWTDQYDHKLQIAGIPSNSVQFVPRGESIYGFLADGTLGSVESINRPVDHIQARKLLETKVPVSPAQVVDASFDLKALTRARGH